MTKWTKEVESSARTLSSGTHWLHKLHNLSLVMSGNIEDITGCGRGVFSANFCSSWFEHSHPGRLTAGINKKLISFSSWPHIRFIHKVTLYKNNSTPLPPSTGVQVPEQHGEISFGRMEAQEWFQLLQDVEVGLAKQGGIVPHHCGPSRWC